METILSSLEEAIGPTIKQLAIKEETIEHLTEIIMGTE